jgi:hypothetical protein
MVAAAWGSLLRLATIPFMVVWALVATEHNMKKRICTILFRSGSFMFLDLPDENIFGERDIFRRIDQPDICADRKEGCED